MQATCSVCGVSFRDGIDCWYFPIMAQIGARVDSGCSPICRPEPVGEDDVVHSFWQSPAAHLGFRQLEENCPGYRHVLTSIWTDGGKPGLRSKAGSIWPVIGRDLCMSADQMNTGLMLWAVCGEHPSNMQTFLRPIETELATALRGWTTRRGIRVNAGLSFISADGPAMAAVLGVHGHVGGFGCSICYMETTSEHAQHGGKYFFGHDRATQLRSPEQCGADLTLGRGAPHRGTKRKPAFMDCILGGNPFRAACTDLSHSSANFGSLAANLLKGTQCKPRPIPGKNKPGDDMEKRAKRASDFADRLSLWTKDQEDHDAWKMDSRALKVAKQRWARLPTLASVADPQRCAYDYTSSFRMAEWTSFLKFFHYQHVGLIAAAKFELLRDICHQFVLLSRYPCLLSPTCTCTFINTPPYRYAVKRGDIPGHVDQVWDLIARCEKDLPRNCMTTALHSMCHLWSVIEYVGPGYVSWTLPLERFMKEMRKNILSTAYPAQNFVNRFQTRQRLSFLPKRAIREIRHLTAQTDYELSNALRLVLTGRARKGKRWWQVRGYIKILNGLYRLSAQGSLPDLFTRLRDHPAFIAPIERADSETRRMTNLDRNGRERFKTAYLLQKIAISFGRSLLYKDRIYSSEYAERTKTTRSSFVWVDGRSVKPTWDGIWHGRIFYFVRVEYQRTIAYLAAIRFFDHGHISDGDHGSNFVQVDLTALSDLGLFPKIYFVEVERIGGRECLCAPNINLPARQLITYIDYLPSED